MKQTTDPALPRSRARAADHAAFDDANTTPAITPSDRPVHAYSLPPDERPSEPPGEILQLRDELGKERSRLNDAHTELGALKTDISGSLADLRNDIRLLSAAVHRVESQRVPMWLALPLLVCTLCLVVVAGLMSARQAGWQPRAATSLLEHIDPVARAEAQAIR